MTTRRYALRDDQWQRIEHLLPGRVGTVRVTARDNRLFVEAALYRYRAGVPWRDLPERFGDFRVIHTRHCAGASVVSGKGSLKCWLPRQTTSMLRLTARLCGPINTVLAQKNNRTQECIGRSSGGLTTKIHATCDALGNPTGFHLSPGPAHDLQGADVLLEALLDQSKALLADIAYAAKARLSDRLEEHQVEAVIPPKSNQKQLWEFDRDKYRW